MKQGLSLFFLWFPVFVLAQIYCGRVTDEAGHGLPFATVYLKNNPMVGTATNAEGTFVLVTDSAPSSVLVLSSMGFATREMRLSNFAADTLTVRLKEQPIELTTTTVEAKKTHQSKRKRMAAVLHEVYTRLENEYPRSPVEYQIVSDVKMEARTSSWGMEEMLAKVVQIPTAEVSRKDSMQFVGEYCKRYCNPLVRAHADQLLQQETDQKRKHLALSIDSGTIVHRKMWEMSQLERENLLDLSDELGRWKMQPQDAAHTVLTYTRKRDYIGIVKITEIQDLLIDNDGSLQTYTQEIRVKVFLPFSIKVKDADLVWLNLLNVDDERLSKFRLKKADMQIRFQTIYTRQDGVLVPKEKNMHIVAMLEDNKKNQLPCELWGSQHIHHVRTTGVRPLRPYRSGQTVSRVLVPIY